MVSKLKYLFQTKDLETTSQPEELHNTETISSKRANITYREYGHRVAGQCEGDRNALYTTLTAVMHQIKNEHFKDTIRQEEHRNKVRKDIEALDIKIASSERTLRNIEEEIREQRERVEELEKEAIAIKRDPSIVGGELASGKVGFYIGIVILIFLTLYLFVFYSSASYSALFKVFSVDENAVHQAIFDARAIHLAWEQGFTALLFILLIPFVFLGLGFLIHKFQESKSLVGYLKSFLLIAITFVFDAFLAYHITKAIYDVHVVTSFDVKPEYTPEMAIADVNFWIIIFAGFLVYLIWGFVFDFTMMSHAEMDKVNARLRVIREEQTRHRETIEAFKKTLKDEQDNKDSLELQRVSYQKLLNDVCFNTTELNHELNNFFQGWLQYVAVFGDTDPHLVVFESFMRDNKLQVVE